MGSVLLLFQSKKTIMDHPSELEQIPLSSGIDDFDHIHKPQSHPFSQSPIPKGKKPILELPNVIRDKLRHHKPDKHIINDNNNKPKPIQNNNNNNNNVNNDQMENLKDSESSVISQPFRRFIKVLAPSIGFFGCQFAWACQGGYVDPYLRQLGLPDDMMNYAWILGPISGIIIITIHCILAHNHHLIEPPLN